MTKVTSSLSISTLLGLCLLVAPAQPGQAAVGDPELILYRFSGVRDGDPPGIGGVATAFFCTNFSGVTETIRIVVRNSNTTIRANKTINIPHLVSRALLTKPTNVCGADILLDTGSFDGGTAAIAATSTSIVCTAMILDAVSESPVGIALHGIRFNPAPGSQE
jgi:hypothetical protein